MRLPERRRSCPACHRAVGAKRMYLKSTLWSRWDCPGCGAHLEFDPTRRVNVAGFGALLGIGPGVIGATSHQWWLAGLGIIAFGFVWSFDSVRLRGEAASRGVPQLVVSLLVFCAAGQAVAAGAEADDPATTGRDEMRVASAIADLAGHCSGRMGLGYVIDGVSGRWTITSGDDWGRTAGGDSGQPAAASERPPMGVLLRALADADASGSADLSEVGHLYQMLHLGYIQAHFRGPDGYDLEGLMVATGLSETDLAAAQAEHADLVKRAATRGLIWPWGN